MTRLILAGLLTFVLVGSAMLLAWHSGYDAGYISGKFDGEFTVIYE